MKISMDEACRSISSDRGELHMHILVSIDDTDNLESRVFVRFGQTI